MANCRARGTRSFRPAGSVSLRLLPEINAVAMKPEEIKTIEALEAEVDKVFLMKDRGIVRVVCATVIANRMNLEAVWLLLVAPSSGGKTEMISALNGLKDIIHPVSDLTVNTFASGQQKAGQETSLLFKINNGILTFKDFTSVLSKNKDARKEIMSQLREIYDGEYTKRTGTGKDIKWRGKSGAIAGSTEVVYRHLEELSAMGDRFIMYNIEQPDRRKVAKRALQNAHKIKDQREHLQACFAHYIRYIIEHLDEEEIKISEEIQDDLLDVADFSTQVRSAVINDFKTGIVEFVPSKEMPMRMTQQLSNLASAFIAMRRAEPNSQSHTNKLTELEAKILYKTALDSIPRTRRDALYPLAEYLGGVHTVGLAQHLNLPTASTRKYLEQLSALNICKRQRDSGPQGDLWKIEEKYRPILVKIKDIKTIDKVMIGVPEEEEGADAAWEASKTPPPPEQKEEYEEYDPDDPLHQTADIFGGKVIKEDKDE